MNILVTLDRGYIQPLTVMLKSLLTADRKNTFDVYVMNSALEDEDFDHIESTVNCPRLILHDIKTDSSLLADAPVTDRYPKEMYYRIFAARFLPEHIDRILYLDPDLIVLKPLEGLYTMDMGDNFFAAASHVGSILTKVNSIRLNTDDDNPYINSGVMLMNIAQLRKEQDFSRVFGYIEKYRNLLILPDQDVISAVYGDRIIPLDPLVYNMTERALLLPESIGRDINLGWVAKNTAIIHFLGRNKPWKERYAGPLGFMWHYMENLTVE